MTNLITPPDDLLRDWARFQNHEDPEALWRRIATLAARWGADQELEACKQYMHDQDWFMSPTLRMSQLHNARRPKPPSLKEQALEALEHILHNSNTELGANTIRRALEALPND
jgi:hypothetical protein